MIKVEQELIKCLSFCDTPVTKMELKLNEKSLKIFVRSAVIKDNRTNYFGNRTDMILGKGILVFTDWSSLTLLTQTHNGENFIDKLTDIDENLFDPLDEILIFDQIDNRVEISGFSRDGIWEKWTIVDSQYYGEFEDFDTDPY